MKRPENNLQNSECEPIQIVLTVQLNCMINIYTLPFREYGFPQAARQNFTLRVNSEVIISAAATYSYILLSHVRGAAQPTHVTTRQRRTRARTTCPTRVANELRKLVAALGSLRCVHGAQPARDSLLI